MDIEPVGDIIRRIKKKYDNDPENWKVVSGTDRYGNRDLFLLQQPNIWQIKSKALSPVNSIAMGSHARRLDDEINEKIGKMQPTDINQLFGMMVPVEKDQAIITTGVENYSPKKTRVLKSTLREGEKDGQKQLEQAVEKEFAKKHPQRKNMFV